jgi:hypothetical protein
MHQQFYLANKTWISACYLDAGTLLFNGQCIIKSEIINNVSTCYNFSTQEQSYFIYPNIYVHNFDLVVLSSTGTFILGAIEISNPVTILLGIIIPLSLYAIQNFESHIAPDYKIKDDSDFSKDSYLQNNKVIQKTREYYDSKRHALQNLYEDLIKIKNDLSFFIKLSDKNNFSFSFNFLPTIQLTNYTLINLPSLSQELALSNIDKQKLIKIRNDELEKLQQNIFDIHLCLAFHINELIERRNQTNEQLHDVSKKVNQWVHSWNNNLYNIPNDVALNHYEIHFTLKETLDNLEIKTNEIKYILSYYERLKNNFFVHKTTNIANIIAQQSKINTDILESIALNRNIWWSNMCITENLLTDRNLLSIQLVNCYTNKAKEFIAEQEKNNFIVAQKKKDSMLDIIKKEQEKQKSTCSSGGDPNNNDPDDENFFENLKKRADKKARSIKFGMMYRDPKTGLWWSKDMAGHSGLHYKVFREAAKGFRWLFDANSIGEMIIEKHKGPIGRFIPYSEVVFL